MYSFGEMPAGSEMTSIFAIDRFSGKIILKKKLDFEKRGEYKLKIQASDKNYSVETIAIIQVTDTNDNTPVFDKTMYQTTISSKFIILYRAKSQFFMFNDKTIFEDFYSVNNKFFNKKNEKHAKLELIYSFFTFLFKFLLI